MVTLTEANESKNLINEIVNSITKPIVLEDMLVVVSLPYEPGSKTHHHNNKDNKPSMSCDRTILPRFDKCIEVINGKEDKENNNMIDIKISNDSKKTKNTTNDCHNRKLLSINNLIGF